MHRVCLGGYGIYDAIKGESSHTDTKGPLKLILDFGNLPKKSEMKLALFFGKLLGKSLFFKVNPLSQTLRLSNQELFEPFTITELGYS